MKTKLALFGVCVLAVVLTSCGGYNGYKMSPYTVRGERYHPMSIEAALDYQETGTASWYDESRFFGLKRGVTAIGEKMMPWDVSGAHKTLPLPCVVKVTNLENGESVKMRINDRGPFIPGRLLDVSPRAAKKLGFYDRGLATVHVEVISVGDGAYKRKKRTSWFF
ncbi:MAG TPA: septal ring lytic transglycosylase RlpA family protein [Luteolibacter sp.]|nr:septal ring lytic transglycosylase RlpA family protein [Luteolibacter sp.]